ncbi:flagellar hook-length control protein FliK [Caulobacter segnis]|nr:flagellar hook-length control protein FliK [Caulobacter segnis]
MADVAAMLEHPETPLEVRSVGEALLARIPRAAEMSTAQGLRTAVEQSGVFLEARLARGAQSGPDGEPLAGSPETDLKAGLLVFKDALSGWLARTALTPLTPARSMESLHRPPSEPLGADLLSEASPPAGTTPRWGERDADVSGAHARSAGPSTNDDDAVEPRFAAFIAPSKAAPSAESARPASSALGLLDLAQGSPANNRPALAPLAVRGYGGASIEPQKPSTPPPPFADGPMAGQRPTPSQLPAGASSEEIVRRLLKGVSAALSRQVLMQIASLREVHQDPETGESRTPSARLNLDLPFVTPQGVAVAQFEITRDGGGPATGSAERTYRVRFSIDVEPLGPVHALITLAGKRARVSLWAARSEIVASLRASQESLGAALRQAQLTPEIAIHSGPPPVKDAGALGHFVDQAS